jgi:hypothetical protein
MRMLEVPVLLNFVLQLLQFTKLFFFLLSGGRCINTLPNMTSITITDLDNLSNDGSTFVSSTSE